VLVRHVALKPHGASVPSGLDAFALRQMCTSFQVASNDLCDALASVARRLCTTFVNPAGLSYFVADQYIALDKKPGVRPIGIGETVHCLVTRSVLAIICGDIQTAAARSS